MENTHEWKAHIVEERQREAEKEKERKFVAYFWGKRIRNKINAPQPSQLHFRLFAASRHILCRIAIFIYLFLFAIAIACLPGPFIHSFIHL